MSVITMADRGYTNPNSELNQIEHDYLFGNEQNSNMIATIKRIRYMPKLLIMVDGRESCSIGLKATKDLVEIWMGRQPISGSLTAAGVLKEFGYVKTEDYVALHACPMHSRNRIEWREVGQYTIRLADYCPVCGLKLDKIQESDTLGRKFKID